MMERWRHFGRDPPFRYMQVELYERGLTQYMRQAREYLGTMEITFPFQQGYIEPCARNIFSQNLDHISALSAMVASQRSVPLSVVGGNTELIKSMLESSEANVELNSRVQHIMNGSSRRFNLLVDRSGQPVDQSTKHDDELGIVIVTVPYWKLDGEFSQLYGLEEEELARLHGREGRTGAKLPTVQSHVTVFATELPLSSRFLDPSKQHPLPHGNWVLLTASKSLEDPDIISVTKQYSPYSDYSWIDDGIWDGEPTD
jgi:hypothetical protein